MTELERKAERKLNSYYYSVRCGLRNLKEAGLNAVIKAMAEFAGEEIENFKARNCLEIQDTENGNIRQAGYLPEDKVETVVFNDKSWVRFSDYARVRREIKACRKEFCREFVKYEDRIDCLEAQIKEMKDFVKSFKAANADNYNVSRILQVITDEWETGE